LFEVARRTTTMLVLSRKPGEKILIGSGITITVVQVRGNQVRIGIDAPAEVRLVRAELNGLPGQSAAEPLLSRPPPPE
jgi:carbon storage regulator CsrA